MMAIALASALLMLACSQPGAKPAAKTEGGKGKVNLEHSAVNYWKDSTFHQTSIDLKDYAKGIIRARVEGVWQELAVRELPKAFLDWNFAARHGYLETIRKGEMPSLAGPHNGIVASHGLKRNDAQFALNNAVKGMGFIPKPERLAEMIALLKKTWNDSMDQKVNLLDSLYTNHQDYYDKTKMVSLELYSTPNFETHTFLNQMTDPGVAIVFMAIPTYEVRAVAQMLHPKDPQLTAYEKQVVEWINTVHDYFHGDMGRQSIGVIYHVTEVFDSSPGRGGKGKRIVPLLP
jgi:hypothetical protein